MISLGSAYGIIVLVYHFMCGVLTPHSPQNDSIGSVSIRIPIQRLPDYYVKVFFIPMCILTSLFPLCFIPTAAKARLGSYFSLILTNVALQMTLRNSAALPRVPYSTLLDDYMVVCFAMLVAVCICSVLVVFFASHAGERVSSGETVSHDSDAYVWLRYIDGVVIGIFGVFWVFYNIVLYRSSKSLLRRRKGLGPEVPRGRAIRALDDYSGELIKHWSKGATEEVATIQDHCELVPSFERVIFSGHSSNRSSCHDSTSQNILQRILEKMHVNTVERERMLHKIGEQRDQKKDLTKWLWKTLLCRSKRNRSID